MKSVSIVVPVYNEEGNVKELHNEIKEICVQEGYDYEIIFINDGSSDKTDEICSACVESIVRAMQEEVLVLD